jgi:hypothetical protein
MPKKANQLKTIHELTPKQRKFVDVLVGNWGLMSKTQAAKEAGIILQLKMVCLRWLLS